VNFSLNDLKKHKIHYTLQQDLAPTETYLHQHKKAVNANIRTQVEALPQKNYREVLFDEAQSLKVLTDIIKDAEERLNKASPDEKGQAQIAVGEKILANEAYQLLVNSYPHETDKDFSSHPAIQEIKATIGKRLTPKRAATLIETLRHDYDKKIEVLKDDCKSYFDLGTDSESMDFINRNPANMQTIFRQQALISQEVQANPYYNPIIPLLDGYKAERENRSSHEYTGLFGKLKRAFGAYSKQEKHEAIDALVDALNCPGVNKLERKHIGALKQGELGKLVKTLDIKLETYAMDAGKTSKQKLREM